MITITLETIPATWVEERDVPFFRLTATAFSSTFAAGASALLASYDSDESGVTSHASSDSDVTALSL